MGRSLSLREVSQGDNLKDEASKVENQLINVIASLGRAEQATGSTLYTLLFDGQDHTDYNRIGLYWESSTLPDTSTAEVKSVDAHKRRLIQLSSALIEMVSYQ